MEHHTLFFLRRGAFGITLSLFCLLFPAFAYAAPAQSGDIGSDSCIPVTIHRGKASFLGKKFQGRKTASGEIFRHEKLTAAHKTLPFGTVLRVTRLSNGRSVLVRVNDRGPFVEGRFVDLSRLAATKLNMLRGGVTDVQFEVVSDPRGQPLLPSEAFYVVLSRSGDPEAAMKAGKAVSQKVPSKHRPGLKKAALFSMAADPRLPRYFMGMGPFHCFEDAHKVFLSLPANTGHSIICATASRNES